MRLNSVGRGHCTVTFSKWAAPIVPVLKRDGSIRICGDYMLTVNRAAGTDPYPLPRIDDIFTLLAQGKTFTKLDSAHAYQQVPLDNELKDFTTINTHHGLFLHNRLPFGVASAPSIFQRTMENLLQGTSVYLEFVCISMTSLSRGQHLRNT